MLTVREEDIDRITEAVYHVLQGRLPEPIVLPDGYPDDEVKQLAKYVNALFSEYSAVSQSLFDLSRGELDAPLPRGKMYALQSLKNLQANLRHLAWKTQQIAKGDFSQKVDFMGELSAAFNTMAIQLRDAFERIEEQNRALAEANRIIQDEKEKSERLLLNVLPASVADELKRTGKTAPELFEHVTVLFSDLVGFTQMSSSLSPAILIEELNDIFTEFDGIAEANGCERIKTIGDAYLAVCGMPRPDPNHALNIVRAADSMVRWLRERNATAPREWLVRIGIHSGPVVGSVVGVKKYIYDVFGDTVNTASRMESHSAPMRINVSGRTHALLESQCRFSSRSEQEVKGKGVIPMYFLEEILVQ